MCRRWGSNPEIPTKWVAFSGMMGLEKTELVWSQDMSQHVTRDKMGEVLININGYKGGYGIMG
jgi:hypothetical protein